jgi:glycosyltransferase involved in cell wall biosynthesis
VNVLVVSGIWPPDVGGPASHAVEVAEFLHERGHHVEVVTSASAAPSTCAFPVHWVSRRLPKGVVHARAFAEIALRARRAEIVYTTGMFARTAAACLAVRRPYVLKLTGDPAFERARWRGRVGGDIETFQASTDARILRVVRDATVRGAAHVVCPSAFLGELALRWGVASSRISVVPNPAPRTGGIVRRRPHDGIVLAFAGRFGPQKALDVLFVAVQRVPTVRLRVAGAGKLDDVPRERVELLGSLPREEVLQLFADADASVLSSSWENFPHTLVESLAVGTPVIATAVGGVPEVVEDGVNGLLVPPGDVSALAAAIERFAADADLRARLSAAAAPSVARFAPEEVYGELERVLEAAAG